MSAAIQDTELIVQLINEAKIYKTQASFENFTRIRKPDCDSLQYLSETQGTENLIQFLLNQFVTSFENKVLYTLFPFYFSKYSVGEEIIRKNRKPSQIAQSRNVTLGILSIIAILPPIIWFLKK
jgi:hypothetical protein